jgi:hypothetical protein
MNADGCPIGVAGGADVALNAEAEPAFGNVFVGGNPVGNRGVAALFGNGGIPGKDAGGGPNAFVLAC